MTGEERVSWAVSDPAVGLITTEDARLALTALAQPGSSPVRAADGIRPAVGNPGQVTVSSVNTGVTVQPFQMLSTPRRGPGSYVQTLGRAKDIDILKGHPASSTADRTDLIVAVQTDTFYGDTTNTFEVKQIVGGVDTEPVGAVRLASILVPANATAVKPENITDLRPPNVVALGGVVPVRGRGDLVGLAAYPGMTAYQGDRQWLTVNDGAGWRVPSIPVCTSLTDISAPYQGQLVVNYADGLVYSYDGANWVGVVATGSGGALHEARYEVGTNQSFPVQVDTPVVFSAIVYQSPDVRRETTRDRFTLLRGGLWHISFSLRINAPAPGGQPGEPLVNAAFYEAYMAIVNGQDLSARYTHQHTDRRVHIPTSISCSTVRRFDAGAQVCGILWNAASQNRTIDRNFNGANSISLTWLRP